MPSMAPSHAGPAPMAARNAGRTAVAVSWLQSLKRLVSPTPRTVRLSQDRVGEASGIEKESTVESWEFKVRKGARNKTDDCKRRAGKTEAELLYPHTPG